MCRFLKTLSKILLPLDSLTASAFRCTVSYWARSSAVLHSNAHKKTLLLKIATKCVVLIEVLFVSIVSSDIIWTLFSHAVTNESRRCACKPSKTISSETPYRHLEADWFALKACINYTGRTLQGPTRYSSESFPLSASLLVTNKTDH